MSTLATKLRNKVLASQSLSSHLPDMHVVNTATCVEPQSFEDHKSSSGNVVPKKITDIFSVKKKRNRFNGTTEDEVLDKLLPDHLDYNLDIIIIGINPGLTAAHVGHHYAGPGNHFWKCLFLSGLTSVQMNAYDDHKLKNVGIGFTNIVARTSRGSADLSRAEIKEGAIVLNEKIKKYRPKIAVFNGKGIYEVFCGHKHFFFGKQPEPFPDTDTVMFVMPSSSARCSQLPRAVDKVPFYVALRKLRDHLCGHLPDLDQSEVIFPDLELKVEPKREPVDGEKASKNRVGKGKHAAVAVTASSSTNVDNSSKKVRISYEHSHMVAVSHSLRSQSDMDSINSQFSSCSAFNQLPPIINSPSSGNDVMFPFNGSVISHVKKETLSDPLSYGCGSVYNTSLSNVHLDQL